MRTGLGDHRLMQGGAGYHSRPMPRRVKRRLYQHRFRELVVATYGESCTVCRRTHNPELLDAAHILEAMNVRGLTDVPNGLALCKIHDGAYDVNIFGIEPIRHIHIREDIRDEVYGPMLRYG